MKETPNPNADGRHPAIYQSYLLRLWKTEQADWHASLEDSRTGERIGFANLDQLFAFLMEQVAALQPRVRL
ncbi:MAG TPA: hypothetical protein VF932_01385 [Anaerolineae bacterium]